MRSSSARWSVSPPSPASCSRSRSCCSHATSPPAVRRSREGDVAYRIAPERTGLWRARTIVPFDSRGELLGVEDDVEMRRAVRSVRLARLDDPTVSLSDPHDRAASQRRAGAARGDRRGREGSGAALPGSRPARRRSASRASSRRRRTAWRSCRATVANLQLAIALDPSNDEAKYNLELALQRARGVQLTEGAGGQNPTPGGAARRARAPAIRAAATERRTCP